MKIPSPSEQIICPQMGMEPKSNIVLRKARRTFNSQRWRKDVREAVSTRNWDQVTWLEKYYDTILSS